MSNTNKSNVHDVHRATEILGIEKYLSSTLHHEHVQWKRHVIDSVSMEQVYQESVLCHPDPDQLAMVSRHYSRWTVEWAQHMALLLGQDLMSFPYTNDVRDDASVEIPQLSKRWKFAP